MSRIAKFGLPTVLTALSALIPWGWTPASSVVAGIDTPPNVDFSVLFRTTLHTWDPVPNGGISNFVGYGMYFPYFIVGAWLQAHGVTPHYITISALSLAFAVGALGFYLFVRILGCNAFLNALLTIGYTLNFGHTFLAPGAGALFAYAALPWAPLAAVWAARSSIFRQLLIGLLFALASTGLIYIKINPPTYIAFLIGGIVISILALIARRLRFPAAMFFAFWFGFALLNAWWIVDFALGVHLDPAAVTVGLNVESVSAASTLAQVLLLGGSWAFDPLYDPNPYFAYAEWYRSGGVQFLLALLPAMTVATLLLFRACRAAGWILAAMLLFVFLDAGYHPPFGFAFLWIFRHVPFAWLYREPLTKFDGILGVVYLSAFALLVPQAENVHRRIVGTAFALLAIIGCVTGGIPLATGSVVRPAIGTSPSFKVQVPSYWIDFAAWANANEGGRIAMLPQNAHYELLYDWGYLGADIDGMLLRHPFIDITPSAGYTDAGMKQIEMAWYDSLANRRAPTATIRRLSDTLDIKYAVVRHDVLPTLLSPHFTPESVYLPKLKAAGFQEIARFGKLDVYGRSCCVDVKNAVLLPAPLWSTNTPPAAVEPALDHPTEIIDNGDTINGKVVAQSWVPSNRFVFGLRGITLRDGSGIETWSALGRGGNALASGKRGTDTFVAVGALISRVVPGRTFDWTSEPGTQSAQGHFIRAVRVDASRATSVTTLSGVAAGYGLVRVLPLSRRCSIVSVDTSADKAHLIFANSQGAVVPPYRDAYTVRISLGSRAAITVRDCDPQAAVAVPFVVERYRVLQETNFNIDATPRPRARPLQIAQRRLVLTKTYHDAGCRCQISYASLPMRVPDYVLATLIGGVNGRLGFGRVDATGAVRVSDAVALQAQRAQGAAGAGNLIVACACEGVPAVVNVTFGSLQAQTVRRSYGSLAVVKVNAASETGSSGLYRASSSSELVLRQSYSNGWELLVDGMPAPHFATVTKQNGWVVPAGMHRYVLMFRLENTGSALLRVAELTAIAFTLLILAGTFAAWRFRL